MTVQTPRRAGVARVPTASSAAGGSGRKPPARRAAPSRTGRRKDPIWARLLVLAGALLMMTSGGAVIGSKLLISQATSTIGQGNLVGNAGKTAAEGGKNLDGPIDLLLLGIDARGSWKPEDTRADTIIVLHIPASHDQAYLISIPRDTEVAVPAFPKSRYGGGTAKANEAFFIGAQNGGGREGGAQLMAQTIKNLTGIGFDGAAIIDFNGFKGVIDALGTIRMCVDQKVTSHHIILYEGKPRYMEDVAGQSGTKTPVVYEVGCRNMKGWQALDYSRQRYGLKNGDYDRQRHQQQLIKAMAHKAMGSGILTNPLKLKQLLHAAGKAFTLDTGGVPIADFIFTMRNVTPDDLVLLRTNNGTFHSDGAGKESVAPISQEMFAAARNDTLGSFVASNPAVLAPTN